MTFILAVSTEEGSLLFPENEMPYHYSDPPVLPVLRYVNVSTLIAHVSGIYLIISCQYLLPVLKIILIICMII